MDLRLEAHSAWAAGTVRSTSRAARSQAGRSVPSLDLAWQGAFAIKKEDRFEGVTVTEGRPCVWRHPPTDGETGAEDEKDLAGGEGESLHALTYLGRGISEPEGIC